LQTTSGAHCSSQFGAHCSSQFGAHVWKRAAGAAAAASNFSVGLDYLLARVWNIWSAIVGALSLEEDVLLLVWLSSLGFASGVILSQG
jgi:hypothetical protein